MLRPKDLDKLGIFNVMTSRNHEKHRRKIIWYLRLIRLNFLYKIPPVIGWMQVQIAKKIGGAEWGVDEGKKYIRQLKTGFASASSKEEKITIQKEIDGCEWQLSINNHLIKEWKLVADAIAWKILKYQRIKIRILSENHSSGLLNFRSDGTRQELATVMDLSLARWKLLIWSDLTNYIRIGDVVVRHSDNQFEILEVKNNPGHRTLRIERQEKRMNEVAEIFNKNVINTSKGAIILDKVDTPLSSYSKDVLELIKQSRKSYVACRKIDDVISVCVHDYGKVEKKLRKNPNPNIFKDKLSPDFPKKKHDKVMTCMSFDYLRREGGEFPRTLAPLTIFPFSSKIISEILSGRLLLTVWIDLNELEQKFKENGWKIEMADLKQVQKENEKIWKSGKFRQSNIYADVIDDTLFKISKGEYHTTLPLPMVIRLGYEFLTTQSLIDIAEDFKKKSDARRHIFARTNVIGFSFELSHEKDLWK